MHGSLCVCNGVTDFMTSSMNWAHQSFPEKFYPEEINYRVHGILCCCDDKRNPIRSRGHGIRVNINYDPRKPIGHIET